MQGQYFSFSRQASKVGVPQRIVKRMKKSLQFQPKSEFYLRIQDKAYIYLIIFCLVGRQGKLTKKIKKVLQSLDKEIRQFIQTTYITSNSQKKSIDAPLELQMLSNTLKCNQKIFKDISNKFHKELIQYPLSVFKLDQCVIFRAVGNQEKNDVDLGESLSPQKLNNSRNAFFLWQEEKQNACFLASFGANSPQKESKIEELISNQEKRIIDSRLPQDLEQQNQETQRLLKVKKEDNKRKEVSYSGIVKKTSGLKSWNNDQWLFTIILLVVIIGVFYVHSHQKLRNTFLDRLQIQNDFNGWYYSIMG